MTITETHSPETITEAGVAGLEVAPRLTSAAETAEELVASQRQNMELTARVLALETELRAAQYDQITDGSDHRLERFWEKAGRIADHADFCEEYDRMAEAMNGPRRERDYTVTMDVTLRVRVTRTVSATDDEGACDYATDDLSMSEIEEAVSNGDAYDWTLEGSEATRD
ncbi:hypothetical protein C5D98_14810 [Rathayibacter rathayi]|uniref:hypothetical protein n=1 Tax=Rathayibacter rathayi TaxID=33887 RepID=UPI000CE77DB3|nr:hypothetical protein [Rathayibacter rathayi]PPG77452.1 hypothetical protein C5C15_09155 [Rathayibacter rathayi]PPI65220.1 hypothetical protein C5D98_14810 [Rathayibacter rathayi]